jgi:hypothetical protein
MTAGGKTSPNHPEPYRGAGKRGAAMCIWSILRSRRLAIWPAGRPPAWFSAAALAIAVLAAVAMVLSWLSMAMRFVD